MIKPIYHRLFLGYLILAILFAANVPAQLSPGDLHEVHAQLEGVQNCQRCHEAGKKVSPANCLKCHEWINRELPAKEGLHGLNEYNDCAACHVEHLGRDSELIIWLEGESNFDHSLTGYLLEGKHASLNCRKCHRPENIRDGQLLSGQYKDLNRTFLGLNRSCLGCHNDEHRGQLKSDCLSCHNYTAFKPATTFNHQDAQFQLTGKHLQVPCEKCHLIRADDKYPDDKEYTIFRGIRYESCQDCHLDKHAGKLGVNCRECHSTSGWQAIDQASFDHSRTGYPLAGRHASVRCEKCHAPGQKAAGLKHEKCIDCHKDYHHGQFAGRPGVGECAECHTVDGFVPALFSMQQHQQTKFPLAGSHQAVPCIACHKSIIISDTIKTAQFKFESSRCRACHNDPHAGEVDKYVLSGGCEYCHDTASWRVISFNHDQTKFALEGKHRETGCGNCHKPVEQAASERSIRFTGLISACENCHRDIHQGQFTDIPRDDTTAAPMTDCSRCHSPNAWFADRFDHGRTAFKLEGAHQKVECAKCHKKIMQGDREFTWFKPVATACADCHGNKYTNDDLGDL